MLELPTYIDECTQEDERGARKNRDEKRDEFFAKKRAEREAKKEEKGETE